MWLLRLRAFCVSVWKVTASSHFLVSGIVCVCLDVSHSHTYLSFSSSTCSLLAAAFLTKPTAGQVQSRKCIEEVLHFAYEENLFVMSDEVIVLHKKTLAPWK